MKIKSNEFVKPIPTDYLTISFGRYSYRMKIKLTQDLINSIDDSSCNVKEEFTEYILDTITRLEKDRIFEHLLWNDRAGLPDDTEYHKRAIDSKHDLAKGEVEIVHGINCKCDYRCMNYNCSCGWGKESFYYNYECPRCGKALNQPYKDNGGGI